MAIRHDTTAPRSSLWNNDHIWPDDPSNLLVDPSVSGAYTADVDDAPNQDLTLTGNTTITPDHTGTTDPDKLYSLLLLIRQDGTGGWTLGWGGTIFWTDGEPTMPTDPDSMLIVPLFSYDEGATWIGVTPGGGGGASALDDLTDVTLTAPALGDKLRFDGSEWVNSPKRWVPMTIDPLGTDDWELLFTDDGDVMMMEIT